MKEEVFEKTLKFIDGYLESKMEDFDKISDFTMAIVDGYLGMSEDQRKDAFLRNTLRLRACTDIIAWHVFVKPEKEKENANP